MKRVLFIAGSVLAFAVLTGCNPEETLQTVQHVYDGHRTPADDPSTPGVESDPSQPPVDDVCAQCIPVVTIPPEAIPVPPQIGWTWDISTFSVTNKDVGSLEVRAQHGPFGSPLLVPFVTLGPGQSVTIPAAPCGSPVKVFIRLPGQPQELVQQPFTFC